MMGRASFVLLLLLLATLHAAGQTPYERRLEGIIYGSSARLYADGTTIQTGQFYNGHSFLVRTDTTGLPTRTRRPYQPGRFTNLRVSGFTTAGEALCFHTHYLVGGSLQRAATLSKWNTDLDTLWAYAYRDTAFDTSDPNPDLFTLSDDGCLLGLLLTDTVVYTPGNAVAFVDTDGAVQWVLQYPIGLMIDHVVRASDGGFLAAARDGSQNLCFKTDAQFSVQWCQAFSAPYALRAARVAQDEDGVVHYFTGIRDTAEVINSGTMTYSRSMAWLDLDPTTGALLNTREVDFRWPTAPTHLQRTADGNFLAAGTYTNNTRIFNTLRRWEAYVLKLTPGGDVLWADTLAITNNRSRVNSLHELGDRLLFYTERYDHINPWHQIYLLDSVASPICGLERGLFQSLGPLPITAAPYVLPSFTPSAMLRTPITWSIDTVAMTSIHQCADIPMQVEGTAPEALQLFPNPVADRLHLPTYQPDGQARITITDAYGRVALSPPDHGTVDVSGLAPGIYVLLREAGSLRSMARFIKE
jgi:hypothetical protein